MKLQIIETEQYILAVSDEEPTDGNITLHPNGTVGILTTALAIALFKETNEGSYVEDCKKIIAYQPKGNATELDLPLLPEIDVEDDVFELADNHTKKLLLTSEGRTQRWWGFIEGYKAATKVYSEEDLKNAIELTILNCIVDTIGYDNHVVSFEGNIDEIIQSLKQPKTPKWFVAEMEYQNLDGNWGSYYPFASSAKDSRFKTTTINGKTYLVGHYE